MRLLLDTHAWLWMLVSPERLRPEVREIVTGDGDELLLSAASAWEIAIKWALGKLSLPEPPGDYVRSRMRADALTPLPVSHDHALRVAELPHHHGDPFDRMLIAQAQEEELAVLTSDPVFGRYDVAVVAAG